MALTTSFSSCIYVSMFALLYKAPTMPNLLNNI